MSVKPQRDFYSKEETKNSLNKFSEKTETHRTTFIDKAPPFFGNPDTELQKEHSKYHEMFQFPLNPAFYTSHFAKAPKRLQTIGQFL